MKKGLRHTQIVHNLTHVSPLECDALVDSGKSYESLLRYLEDQNIEGPSRSWWNKKKPKRKREENSSDMAGLAAAGDVEVEQSDDVGGSSADLAANGRLDNEFSAQRSPPAMGSHLTQSHFSEQAQEIKGHAAGIEMTVAQLRGLRWLI